MARPPAPQALLSVLLPVALAAVAVATLVLLFEATRGKAAPPDARLYVADEANCYLGLAPGVEVTQHKETAEGDLSWTVRTGKRGFRIDEEGSRERSELTAPACRILCLGDSFTQGSWVKGAEAWPAALERSLHARGLRRVQTFNGGMMGHTIAQERMAAARWRALAAEVVIVQTTANDLEDLDRLREASCELAGAPPEAFETPSPEELDVLASTLHGGRENDPPLPDAECEELREAYLKELELLAEQVDDDDAHLLLGRVESPTCGRDPRGWRFMEATAPIVAPAQGRQVDLEGSLTEARASLRPLDSHPSPYGHERLAEAIADELVASQWLAGCQ